MVFKWRTLNLPVSAQAAGEHIEELDKKFGEVTPQILLDDARPEGSLLHPLYEWNDGVAAEKYRLFQSRRIMSELVVVKCDDPVIDVKEPVRAFVSVAKHHEKALYRPVVTAMKEEDSREMVISNAKAELEAVDRKYRGLLDFEKLVMEYLEERT